MVPPGGAVFLAGSTETVRDIVKTHELSDSKGRRIPFTAECWPFARWKVGELTKADGIPDFTYQWNGRRTRICRLTPKTPLKPSTEYRLTVVADEDAKRERTVVPFTTAASANAEVPAASGPATATPFYFNVNAPGTEFNGRRVDRDAKGIVVKMRLPRFKGTPPLFAVWFGKAEGPPNWIVSGSDESIGLGLPDLCGDDVRVPQKPSTVTIRPLDSAGKLGAPIEIAVSTREPLRIFDQW